MCKALCGQVSLSTIVQTQVQGIVCGSGEPEPYSLAVALVASAIITTTLHAWIKLILPVLYVCCICVMYMQDASPSCYYISLVRE